MLGFDFVDFAVVVAWCDVIVIGMFKSSCS